MRKFYQNKSFVSVLLSVVLCFTFVFVVVNASSTISANISTEGTLGVTGVTTLTYASTTAISTTGSLMIGGNATTTSSGAFTTESTAGIASSTPAQELGVTGDVSVGSSATTTIFLDSTTADTGGCLQMRGSDGVIYRLYVTATSTGDVAGWLFAAGTCQ